MTRNIECRTPDTDDRLEKCCSNVKDDQSSLITNALSKLLPEAADAGSRCPHSMNQGGDAKWWIERTRVRLLDQETKADVSKGFFAASAERLKMLLAIRPRLRPMQS